LLRKVLLDFICRIVNLINCMGPQFIYVNSLTLSGPHLELLKDPEGAYSQLIRLQERSQKETDREKPDSRRSSKQQSSSIHPSPSRHMSRESSSHHSFSVPFALPVGIDLQDSTSDMSMQSPQDVSISRLASLNKPEIPFLILGCIASIIGGIVFPVFSILLSNVISAFYQPPHKLKTQSNFWSCMFLAFGAVSFCALPASSYFFAVAGSRLIKRIRMMTFEKMVNMEIRWFDDPDNSSGAVGARLSADAAKVRGLVGDALSLMVQNIATLVAGLVIAFVSNWELSLIILALIPLIAVNGYIQMKFMAGFSADAKVYIFTVHIFLVAT
jgi:ATP-binding cassette, subfamily B (MDR/TAP), member 1